MKRVVLLLAAVSVFFTLLPSPATALTHTVTYTEDGFEPEKITIKVADTVSFENPDDLPLTIKSDPAFPANTSLNIGQVGPRAKLSVTFINEGTFGYINDKNQEHKGTITVSHLITPKPPKTTATPNLTPALTSSPAAQTASDSATPDPNSAANVNSDSPPPAGPLGFILTRLNQLPLPAPVVIGLALVIPVLLGIGIVLFLKKRKTKKSSTPPAASGTTPTPPLASNPETGTDLAPAPSSSAPNLSSTNDPAKIDRKLERSRRSLQNWIETVETKKAG